MSGIYDPPDEPEYGQIYPGDEPKEEDGNVLEHTHECSVCRERDELVAALRDLLKFNEELCEDIGISKHYPSGERARALLAKVERRDGGEG